MSAVADCPKPIQRRNAQAAGEITIGAATNCNLVQRETEFVRDAACLREQCCDLLRTLQRRTVHATFYFQSAVRIQRTKAANPALHHWPIAFSRDAQIHLSA